MHECFIGLLYYTGRDTLATLQDLSEHILERKQFNETIPPGLEYLHQKEWSLRDYTDKRKSTNLYQFDFCPVCGKAIEWKAIRRLEDGKI
jgi:hypothetical protein